MPVETAFDRQRAGPTTSTSTNPSPGSPTFTNPDMILPYESERESSTPSPPFKALHLQHVHPQSLSHSPQNHSTTGASNGFSGMALPAKHSSVSPARHRSNTWESENDEARSIASTGSEAHHLKGGDPRNNRAWSTDGDEERDAENSSISSSTVSASSGMPKQSPPRSSRFRRHASEEGDYRNASRESDRGADEEQYGAEMERRKMGAIAEEEDEEKEDSDREISSEAERILENAKKRLTSMEGNLNRARTSFRMTPSPAPQLQHHSFGIHGIHNGPLKSGVRPERRAQTSLAGALLRQRASQDAGAMKSYHSRGLSDIYVSPSLRNDPTAETKHSFRSISALGSTNASGYGASDFSLANGRHRHKISTGSTGSNSSNVFNNPAHTSEPEPEPEPEREQPSPTGPESGGSSAVPHPEHRQPPYQHKSQGSIDSSSSEYSQRESRSEAHVPKRMSREDSKARTPSPSTSAEQWYTGTADHTEHPTRVTPRSRAGSDQQDFSRGFENPAEGTSNIHPSSAQELQNYYNNKNHQDIPDLEDVDEHPDKSVSSTAEIDREALAEILNEPFDEGEELLEQDMEGFPPVPPIAETMRHEDRLDAFDYEHFILHSALGNYSNIRTRPQSYSSTESTETTRPPNDFETNGLPVNGGHHGRKNSVDSISTSATFATATEGAGYTEDEDDGDYWSGNEDLSQMRRKDQNAAHQMTARATTASNDMESPDSPTYPGLVSRSANSTPRAFESTYPISNNEDPRADSNTSDGSSTPVRSIPPESFVEYIISSAVAEESRIHSSISNKLDSDDIELLRTLVQGIGYAGEKLIRASLSDSPSSIDGEPISLLRRRLDTARRALEGGLDV